MEGVEIVSDPQLRSPTAWNTSRLHHVKIQSKGTEKDDKSEGLQAEGTR